MRISPLVILSLLMFSLPAAGESLSFYYMQSRCENFSGIPEDELARVRQVFKTSLQAEALESRDLLRAWNALGFEWLRVTHEETVFWIAAEQSKGCRGRGFYAFNGDRNQQVALQVPHRFMDRHTGTIALDMAKSGRFRAIAWNTVPRRDKSARKNRNADLAHRWDSYFMAFTAAFSEVLPAGRLIQLHGFAANKRKTPEAEGANIIVSSGSYWPGTASILVSNCLGDVFPETVRLFPRDVSELGATRNVQGRLLRSLGHSGFVHVELSDLLRTALDDGARSTRELCRCLTEQGS